MPFRLLLRTDESPVMAIPAGCRPAHERLLLGVELPLDAGLAAIRSVAAALDALPDRQELTLNGYRIMCGGTPLQRAAP